MRAVRFVALLPVIFLHGNAFAEVAQPPLIDGKPAFLLPDFAIDRTLPNLGTEPPAKAPGSAKAKTDDATKTTAPPPRLTWRAVSPTNDIFLERAPGELQ